MSKQAILNMIARMERLADTMYGCSEQELNSLGGQVIGTLRAIREEFSRHGISIDNEDLAEAGNTIARNQDAEEAIYIIHQGAAYLRGLAERIN